MRHAAYFAFILVVLAVAAPVRGQSLVIMPGQPDLLDAQPRQIVTLAFRIRNGGDRDAMLEPELALPRGWSVLGPALPFDLRAGDTSTFITHVQVPDGAPAGDYPIRLVIEDRRNPAVREEWRGRVVVSAVLGVDLRLLEAPEFVLAGERWKAVFLLSSRGNTALDLETEAVVTPAAGAQVAPPRLTLQPEQPARIEVTVDTDPGLAAQVRSQVTLRIQARGRDLSASAVAATDVVPHKVPRSATYRTLPLTVAFDAVTGDREGASPAGQVEVRGRGALDAEGRRAIELDLVGPNGTEDTSTLGRRDEIRLAYRAPGIELRAGDHPFELSPLLELGRLGRGLGVKLDRGLWSLSTFGMNDRFGSLREAGAAVGLRAAERASFSLRYLDKDEEGRQRVAALEARLALPSGIGAEIEAARNVDAAASGAGALRIDLHREAGALRFDGRLLDADEGFGGYTQNRKLAWWHVESPINAVLRLFGSFRFDHTNATPRPGMNTNGEQETRGGASLRLGDTTTITLSAQDRRRTETSGQPAIDSRDQHRTTGALALSKNLGRASLSVHAEAGPHRDLVTGERRSAGLYRAVASVHASERQTLYLSASRDRDYFNFGEQNTAYGVGTSVGVSGTLQLSADLQRERGTRGDSDSDAGERESGSDHDFLQLELEKRTPWGHSIALRGRYQSNEAKPAVWLRYALPLQAPVRRRDDVASVAGRVFEQNTGEGLANVLLRAGRAIAVTDQRGHYRLAALAPGDHRLEVDLRSLGANRVAALPVPMISVVGGERREVDVPIAVGARLSGRLVSYRRERAGVPGAAPSAASAETASEMSTLVEGGGVPGIVLTLTRGEETARRATDAEGRFSFSGMRPGRWELRVDGDGLPPLHRLENDSSTIELVPGDETEIQIRVLPIERRLRLQALPQTVVGMKEGE